MLKKEEKTVNNLERLVGRTVLESSQGKPIAEEVMAELTRRKYKEDYGSQKLGSGVVSLLKNEAIAAASGAAIGYLADGQEGALLGAQYGMTVYTTLWATLNS